MKLRIDLLKLTPLFSWLFRFWAKTIRFEVVEGDWEKILAQNERGIPFITAFWHGELFCIGAFGHKSGHKFLVLISQSKDGELIAQTIEKAGHKTVRGSSSRGGLKALLMAIRVIKKEKNLTVFTVDGPRGPRHKTKDGVIFLAQKAGVQILPVRAYPNVKKIFNSWDKFVLPMPFTKCRIGFGDPITVTEEKLTPEILEFERARLEKSLKSLALKMKSN